MDRWGRIGENIRRVIPLLRWPRIRGVYYGWVIVFVGALAVFLSGPGQTYSVSTFIDPLMDEFNWSRSLVSGLYSAGTLTAGFMMMLVGRTVDSVGYRIALTAVAALFAGALLFMGSVGAPATLLFGFVLIRTLGQGSLTLIPYSLIPQWFVRMRGKTLSILAMAGAIGSATIPLLNLLIMDSAGWRGAWRFWALVLALVMVPLAWKLTRDRPEDLGLLPDGAPVNPAKGRNGETGEEATAEVSWSLEQALRYPPFWVILAASSIPSMVGTGAQFHHMSILAEGGVMRTVAAGVFTVGAVVHLIATPLFGAAADRLAPRHLLVSSLVLQAISLIYLIFVRSTPTALVLGVLNGVRMANVSVINGVIWPAYFGRGNLATIRGVTTTGLVVASALGPLPFGLGFDWFGRYNEVLILMALLPSAGAIASGMLPPPRNPLSEAEIVAGGRT